MRHPRVSGNGSQCHLHPEPMGQSSGYLMYSLLHVTYSNQVVMQYFSGVLLGDKWGLLSEEAHYISHVVDRWHHQKKYAEITRRSVKNAKMQTWSLPVTAYISCI